MRSRFIHLHLENLEARLVAGSYFGGPTGSGGLMSPLAGLVGSPAARTPANPAAGTYRSGSYFLRPEAGDSPQHTAGDTARSDRSSREQGLSNNSSPLTTAILRPTDGDTTAARALDPSLASEFDLDTNLEPARVKAPGHHAALGGDLTGTNPSATLSILGQTGGTGSVAPGSPSVPPAAVPVSNDGSANSISQNAAVVNALGLSTSDNGNAPDVRATTDGLTIPHHHPRIWWDKRNRTEAQTYYAAHPFTPSQDDPLGNAVAYVVTGNTTNAGYAINSLMNFTVPDAELQSAASDTYRWNSWVPVVFDWVHDAMTPDQIQTFTDRYNYYALTLMNKSWGGPTMPANNYFWGYFANELNWAVATYYENPMAQTFLDDALITRWQNSFLPWAATEGVGGVAPEGTQYGRYDLAYPAIPLTAAALLGGEQYSQTNYYKDAIFNVIYSTSPAPTYGKQYPDNAYYMPFPFGEDENNGGYPNIADATYYGDFMQAAAAAYGNVAIGQYAYHWLQTVQPPQTFYTYPHYQDTPTFNADIQTPDFSNLPVDYYAAGTQYFYTRNQWGPQATSVLLQLGQPGEDYSLNAGSFQIWRNSYFVSKNTTGYDLQINGGASEQTVAQNGLLFGGQGMPQARRVGDPQVLRLQSDADFSYAAVDLSAAYRSTEADRDNPYESQAVREFIYIKPLETMVILDRLQSSSEVEPAEDVSKTFLLHFPNAPEQDGSQSWVGYSGDQALRLTTLVPNNVSYNLVDESDFSGTHDPDPNFYQYRLEASTSGSANSYFINVLQARDATGQNVTASMSQNANSWTITLNHPTLGHAKIVLNKGLISQGGAVGYSASGTPTDLTPLLDHVQDMQVTDDGPVWGS